MDAARCVQSGLTMIWRATSRNSIGRRLVGSTGATGRKSSPMILPLLAGSSLIGFPRDVEPTGTVRRRPAPARPATVLAPSGAPFRRGELGAGPGQAGAGPAGAGRRLWQRPLPARP